MNNALLESTMSLPAGTVVAATVVDSVSSPVEVDGATVEVDDAPFGELVGAVVVELVVDDVDDGDVAIQ